MPESVSPPVDGPALRWFVRVAPWALGVLPLALLGRTLGAHKVAGMPTEMLHAQLFAGAELRSALAGVGGLGGAAMWPDNLAMSVLQAALGDAGAGWGYGLGLCLGLALCGLGGWRLVRALGGGPGAALAGGLLLQLCPAVLRGAWSGELALLVVGPVALALAAKSRWARGAWAIWAAAWATPGAVVLLIAAALRRQPMLGLAAIPLLAALASPVSDLPGVARRARAVPRGLPAYVSQGLAVLPLPPTEVAGLDRGAPQAAPGSVGAAGATPSGGPENGPLPGAPPPGTPPAGDVSPTGAASAAPPNDPPGVAVPAGGTLPGRAPASTPPPRSTGPHPGRLPGGLGLWAAIGLALAVGNRRLAGVGAVALAAWIGVFGWLPAQGAPPPIPPEWVSAVGPYVPGLRAPLGAVGWLVPAVIAALFGIATAPRAVWLTLPIVAAALIENPRMGVPLTNIAPEPALATLEGMPAGRAVVFPSPAWPWRQGHRTPAELLFAATRHGHPVAVSGTPGGEAALIATLSEVVDAPVELAAAPIVWPMRDEDPFALARDAGFSALVIDRAALNPDAAARLDAWLAAKVGTPITAQGAWAVHGLGPVGAAR